MKKNLLIMLTVLLASTVAIGQAPGIFNYQGVARNSVGNVLVNKSITLRLTIHDGTAAGPTVYQESRTVVTNPFGLFNAQVGSAGGSAVTGTIAGVPWGVGAKFIQVEIDPNGGTSFINIGTAQIASVPYSLFATSAGDLTLPFIKTQAAAGSTLIGLTNSATTGTQGAFSGTSASTDGNAFAITGTISSVSPGGFSAGVRGINNGTGGLGIGVYGSQAGSGWGIYGTAPSGIGVHGNSASGFGVYGLSTSGVGTYGNSSTGAAGLFEITNNANTSNALAGNTSGTGHAVNGVNTGTGRGGNFQVNNAASTADALRAETNGTGASWAIRGISTGTNGAGLFVQSNATNTSNNLQSNQAGLGRAGLFNGTNAANTANTVEINTAGAGDGLLSTKTATTGTNPAIEGTSASLAGNAVAVQGVITDVNAGGFSAGVRGINNATGGLGIGVWGSHAGSGWGVYGTANGGIGVNGSASSGIGVNGTSNTGTGGRFTTTSGLALHTTGGVRLQGIGEAANRVLTSDAAGNATWQVSAAASDLILPFSKTQAEPGFLFRLINSGAGSAIEGETNSTDASVYAIRGTVTSTAPGGFSSALRGVNNGTGGLGIGIWGSQAGSGWAVYGVTPSGLGVYGNSSGGGTGVFANSNSGIGLNATSNTGIAANINILNNANSSNVLNASTLGNGTVISVNTSGSGEGVFSSSGTGFAVHGITNQQISAGIIGDNTGAGEAVVGRANSNIAGAVVGRNDGGGFGVRGFITTNTSGTAVGVLGQVGSNNSTGRAGRFENSNQANEDGNTLEVETNGNGNIPDNTQGNAASFFANNTNSVAAGLRSEVNTIFGNFGAAGIFGVSSGTGGRAGLFYASNPAGNGASLVAITDGNGNAITANAGKDGNGVESNVDGAGASVYGWVPTFNEDGRAGRFEIFSEDNDNEVVSVKTVGNGPGVSSLVDNTQGTSPALKGEVNSIFSNFGTAGVYGLSSGTGGFAGLFYASNPAGNAPGVLALADGSGNGVTANAGGNGDGIEATCDGNGSAVYGWIPNFGTGRAGRFQNFNAANGQAVVQITTVGTGTTLLINHDGPSGNIGVFQDAGVNVARINKAGRGFFNGGTQASGADVAEAFDVEGHTSDYEAGDILVISTDKDRAVEKSSTPYSTLVAGVYATKPGVLLTEENIDSELIGKVPMGVIGVIPTKVCLEGGAIKRGDMLVTSSIPGVAMKADPEKVKIGQVLGKALQDFDATTVGKINVLVSIK